MPRNTPEKKQITLDSALESLRNLVARRGENFIYKRPRGSDKCVNFNPGNHQPSCAVGQVLYDHGWRHKDLKNKSGAFYELNASGVYSVADSLLLNLEADTYTILGRFQNLQDSEYTYGECLRKVEQEAAQIKRAKLPPKKF